jgi:hypothetical protein
MLDEVDTSFIYDAYFDINLVIKLGLCKFEFEIVDKRGHVVVKSEPYQKSRKFEFEVIDNDGNVMTRGEMNHDERLLIEQLPEEIKKHIRLTSRPQIKSQINYLMINRKVNSWKIVRKGRLRKWYRVLNEDGAPVCFSLPKFRKYPLTFYKVPYEQWLRIERTHENYIFYDENNSEIALVEGKKWEGYYKEFKLTIQQLKTDFMLEVIAIAINLAIQDARNTLKAVRLNA